MIDKEQWNGAPGPMEAEPPGGSAEAPERLSRFRYAAAAAAKGAVVGGTMLIPGVSGGTTAIILGIYDQLVRAVSGFRAHKRESLRLQRVMDQLRSWGTDCAGLGRQIAQANPARWGAIGAEWERLFTTIPVEISVQVTLSRTYGDLA